MISTAQFRNGLRIEIEGAPYSIIEFQHVKPGKGGAFVRTKLKNLHDASVLDKTFRSGEKVGEPYMEEKTVQYLYSDGDSYHFMDTISYEQFSLTLEQLGGNAKFLKENMDLKLLYHNGNPIGVDLPIFVELKIVRTEPKLKGATASGSNKPAELETGLTVKVPPYIEEGEIVKIDTRTGEFIERVKG